MLLATATTEVDSSRRRFSPHFRPDTIPTWALVAHPPHLRFSNNTCRYDGERLAFRQSDVYTVVAGSPEILVACSGARRLSFSFPAWRFICRYAPRPCDRGCRPSALFPCLVFVCRRVRKAVLEVNREIAVGFFKSRDAPQ